MGLRIEYHEAVYNSSSFVEMLCKFLKKMLYLVVKTYIVAMVRKTYTDRDGHKAYYCRSLYCNGALVD